MLIGGSCTWSVELRCSKSRNLLLWAYGVCTCTTIPEKRRLKADSALSLKLGFKVFPGFRVTV